MGFLACHLGIILTGAGIDNTARTVDKQTAVSGHAITAYLLKTAALGSHTGDKKETLGGYLADVLEHLALSGTYDIHHIVDVAPLLTCADDLLEETLAIGVGR